MRDINATFHHLIVEQVPMLSGCERKSFLENIGVAEPRLDDKRKIREDPAPRLCLHVYFSAAFVGHVGTACLLLGEKINSASVPPCLHA